MPMRRVLWLSVTLIVVLALAACGAKPAIETAPTAAAQATAQPAAANPTSAPAQADPTAAPTEAPSSDATEAPVGEGTEDPTGDATAVPGLAAGESGAKPTGDPEPNAREAAADLEAGETTGSLIEDDEDWFTIDVPASGIVTIGFTPDAGSEPMQFMLYDEDDYEIESDYNIGPSGIEPINLVVSHAAGVEYAVKVAGGPGAYSLDVTIDGQDDAGSGQDAGDTPSSAMAIAAGKTITGLVGDLDEADLFKLDIPAGTVLGLSVSSTDGSNKQAALLDTDQDELWSEYSIATRAKSTTLILGHEGAGDYYVSIGGDKGAYELEVTAEPQDDAGSGKDAGDKPASAIAIALGKSYSGLIGDHDAYDLYTFEAKGGDILNVTFTPAGDAEGMSVAVMDPDQYEMWAEYGVGPSSAKTFSHVLDASAGGTYYVAVIDGEGAYTLDLSAASQNDAGSGKDAGDKPATAVAIEPNASYSGQIGGSDAEDLFKFEVAEGEIIALTFAPADDAEPISVSLWDPDLSELWSEYGVGPGVEKTYTYVVGTDLGGTYYVWVGDPEDQDRYTFEIEVSGQDDAGSGGDAGDTPGTAVDVEPDVEYSGLVGNQDTDDYYRWEPEVGQVIVITAGPDAEGLYAAIWDGDESGVWEEYDIMAGDTVEYEIEAIDGETPYYLQIWGKSGTYTVLIEPAP